MQEENPRPWEDEAIMLTRERQWQITGYDLNNAVTRYTKTTRCEQTLSVHGTSWTMVTRRAKRLLFFACFGCHRQVTTHGKLYYFLAPKTVYCDRPVALLATQIRWWEWVSGRGRTQPSGTRQRKKQGEHSAQCGKRCWSKKHTKQMQLQRTQEQSQNSLVGNKPSARYS